MPTATLPDRIPIFPLPNVVLFPDVYLPLHIFEPRYREMVADTIDRDRLIGMVLLRDGWQRHSGPNPPIFTIGCAGHITHVASLADGRYNIVLRGVQRFRVQGEDHSRPYRIATVEILPDRPIAGRQDRLRAGRQRLENLLGRQAPEAAATSRIPPGMADADRAARVRWSTSCPSIWSSSRSSGRRSWKRTMGFSPPANGALR